MRWNVVQTLPSPRERAASMKLHVAGTIEPKIEACQATGLSSVRPWTHGITWTGTSCRCSARWRTASPIRTNWLFSAGRRSRYGPATLRQRSARAARFSGSVTTTKCQFCE